MDQKVYTERKYLNRKIKCLENGIIYNDIKEMCNVLYGPWFKGYNKVGKAITELRQLKGNHYWFVRG